MIDISNLKARIKDEDFNEDEYEVNI